ncbi:unnamed protein product [marine sediment metagenome]|uniref:Methyltransferase small domain-containing protein n=1 Tax=marine sediment metagenome TaxID=412755 RepID=X1ER71_9ZZZZ
MLKDITFYYTNEKMVKDLISILPIKKTDTVLDAGSGKNKVWFNNFPVEEKYECEIEDGCDFMEWNKRVDWIIGNPPFDKQKCFLEQAVKIAQKGIAFLGNINFWNGLTSKRLETIKNDGFELQRIHIVSDKRWFGRYYFLIFEKKKGILSWERKTY